MPIISNVGGGTLQNIQSWGGKITGYLPNVYFMEDWYKLGSPEFDLEDDKSRCTRILYCAWSDLWNAQVNLLGKSVWHPAGGNGWISRYTPFAMPSSLFATSSGAPQLFCTHVKGRGTGLPHTAPFPTNPSAASPGVYLPTKQGVGADATSVYQQARLTCDFEQLPYGILSDADMLAQVGSLDESYCIRYVERQYNPESTLYTMDNAFFQWLDAPGSGTIGDPLLHSPTQRQVPKGVGVTLPYADLVFRWLKVPAEAVPYAAIDATFGCTNDNVFPPASGTNTPNFAAQTVVLTGGKTTNKHDSFGDAIVDVEYNMRFYPLGANKLFSIPDGKPIPVVRQGNTSLGPFPLANFRKLFQPAL